MNKDQLNIKCLIIAISIACLAGGIVFSSSDGITENPDSYTIGPKDLIGITVFGVPQLDITVRVSEDGWINLPLLGKLQAQGLTGFELERKLSNLLEKEFLKDPQVTVFIKEYQSRKVSVIGAVKSPGTYELAEHQTLLQVLGKAGWLTPNATGRIVIIRRNGGDAPRSLVLDMAALTAHPNGQGDVSIAPNDIIHVVEDQFDDIYVFGEVLKPGCIKMKRELPLTLLRAIAQAGGFTEKALKSGVIIKRTVNRQEARFKVNVGKIIRGKTPDVTLHAEDVVFIPESLL
ncbi:MAG: polysaccharide biosynthesis/export family protein [Candidatus Omnitrophota bacterium]